jgi:hypothetical protein
LAFIDVSIEGYNQEQGFTIIEIKDRKNKQRLPEVSWRCTFASITRTSRTKKNGVMHLLLIGKID